MHAPTTALVSPQPCPHHRAQDVLDVDVMIDSLERVIPCASKRKLHCLVSSVPDESPAESDETQSMTVLDHTDIPVTPTLTHTPIPTGANMHNVHSITPP